MDEGWLKMWMAFWCRDNNFIIFCPTYIHSHQRFQFISVLLFFFVACWLYLPGKCTHDDVQSNVSSNCWHFTVILDLFPSSHLPLSICLHVFRFYLLWTSPPTCGFFAFTLNGFLLFTRLFVCVGMFHIKYIGFNMLSYIPTNIHIKYHWIGWLLTKCIYFIRFINSFVIGIFVHFHSSLLDFFGIFFLSFAPFSILLYLEIIIKNSENFVFHYHWLDWPTHGGIEAILYQMPNFSSTKNEIHSFESELRWVFFFNLLGF